MKMTALVRRFGKPGIVMAYIVGLAGSYLIFTTRSVSFFGKEIKFPVEDRILAAVIIVAGLTFFFFVKIKSRSIPNETHYVEPVITTVDTIARNVDRLGLEAAHIGRPRSLKEQQSFSDAFTDYQTAKYNPKYYAENMKMNERISPVRGGADYVLLVRYGNHRQQFAPLKIMSNEVHEAVALLKPYVEKGVVVSGEYERLKDTPEQFTKSRWVMIWATALIITLLFIAIAVYLAEPPV